MPLYHFHIIGDVSDTDVEQTELSNMDAAWHGARSPGSIIRGARAWNNLSERWRAESTDRAGAVLFRIGVAVLRWPLVWVEQQEDRH